MLSIKYYLELKKKILEDTRCSASSVDGGKYFLTNFTDHIQSYFWICPLLLSKIY